MTFGEKLKLLREKYGLTQYQLAELLEMGKTTIGQYETNRREPNFERLRRIAKFFNVDYNYLLDDNNEIGIELDIVELKEILIKNYVTINGKRMSEKAKEGLLIFLENI